ncbi:hypothetical protein [Sphingomonas sp. SRS2]|uniref:hypothetical protein n=1 Tax=Sphingomonas sp. SRS2 TaxID=133190 RepID=UPI0006184890|nr:hypothetical protein [Sphingomonas sp. SRS2]KKC25652.1 hypothetical protein WP12_12640 [Sphingomonas sp. SRS2]
MRDEVESNWRGAVLVCGKCTRKLRGGFGKHGRTPLATAWRKLGNGKKGRKADFGVIETGCLKLCPKGRVVVVDTRQPDRWLLVEPGTPVEDVAARLGVPSQAKGSG